MLPNVVHFLHHLWYLYSLFLF